VRTYAWGFDTGPQFKVEVPDDCELAAASTQYEGIDHPSGRTIHTRVVTVKLYFIDSDGLDPGPERPALTVIGEGS
jgi:hypothetical protein